jgi:hypothetical protein
MNIQVRTYEQLEHHDYQSSKQNSISRKTKEALVLSGWLAPVVAWAPADSPRETAAGSGRLPASALRNTLIIGLQTNKK